MDLCKAPSSVQDEVIDIARFCYVQVNGIARSSANRTSNRIDKGIKRKADDNVIVVSVGYHLEALPLSARRWTGGASSETATKGTS